MNEWMNEWMDGWINEWMNEWINQWMNEWMNGAIIQSGYTVVTPYYKILLIYNIQSVSKPFLNIINLH